MAEIKEMNFEQAMKRLNQIVEDLEKGDASLETSLKLYEEGVKISQVCSRKLEEAQKKVELLLRDHSGDLGTEEVDPDTLKAKAKKPKSK